MSFQIAYGTELDQFTQIDTALYALFKMPFAEEWQNLDTPKARWLTTIYWAFFFNFICLVVEFINCYCNTSVSQKISPIGRCMEGNDY